MHRALTARCLNRALRIREASPSTGVPLYLCPAIARAKSNGLSRGRLPFPAAGRQLCQIRAAHTEAAAAADDTAASSPPEPPVVPRRRLPMNCSGCGAFSQSTDSQQFGYFNLDTKRIKSWVQPKQATAARESTEEDRIVEETLRSMDKSKLEELGLDSAAFIPGDEAAIPNAPERPPICERCHNLVHHSTTSDTAKLTMFHPTVESLRETIEESPHKYNHIYHVIDAADFPMSLIPRLNVLLGDVPLRTRNRRSRSSKYQHDRKTEMSFIITRGDLLGPTKEIVDSMMPYLRDVLRDALGRVGGRIRLGNLKCVSAKRAWWTKTLKEEIWTRGGAGWMVGKVNVGKSQLFEAVYPKGRIVDRKATDAVTVAAYPRDAVSAESIPGGALEEDDRWKQVHVGDLLPPAQPAENYPEMPLVSSLPGTTASPIRIPFGNGKGELIDLPGLARSDLELFVKEEHRQSMIMKTRIVPEQISVKAKQSLILGGGLIRITPRTPDMIFLMYNFTPIAEHLTLTEKAVAFQEQSKESTGLDNITLPGVGEKMKHAGTFRLCHDVTKKRAGPLTRKSAVGLQVDRLPFRVLSVDILVEGVGYVEIVVQVRARDMSKYPPIKPFEEEAEEGGEEEWDNRRQVVSDDPFASMVSNRRDDSGVAKPKVKAKAQPPPPPERDWPAVDVYSPEGRFVGSRQPLNGWLNNKPLVRPEHQRGRPRKSMKGVKKMEKKGDRGVRDADASR